MTWAAWLEFFAMDGYALYVWGSYAVGLALVLTELALLLFRTRAILAHLGWNGSSLEHASGPERDAGDS